MSVAPWVYWVVGISFVLLAVFSIPALLDRRDRKHAEQQRQRDAVERAEKFDALWAKAVKRDTATEIDLFHSYYGWRDYIVVNHPNRLEEFDRYQAEYELRLLVSPYKWSLPLSDDLTKRLQQLNHLVESLKKESSENREPICRQLGIDYEGLKTDLHQTVQKLCNDLHIKAQTGERKALDDLQRLIESQQKYHGVDVQWPEDWDELIIRFVRSPQLSHFPGEREYERREAGMLRLRAAAALGDSNLMEALKVLAHCNDSDTAKKELGDLAGQLASMVNQMRPLM
jgi:hypothetical protein